MIRSDLLSVDEAIEILDTCRSNLYYLFAKYGTPKSIKYGRRRYFDKEDFLAWAGRLLDR